jgi:hypothetical protein
MLVELIHNPKVHPRHDHNNDHHMILESDDDMQSEDLESPQVHHRHRHLIQMDYFFAGSVVFAASLVAGASLLTGVAFASTLQVLSLAGSHLAGAAAALAAGAGAAAVLAGSVAKAAVATKVAIRVAIVFI